MSSKLKNSPFSRQPLNRHLSKLLSSKKAADPSQIFIYIAAIVVVGFVFLFGFKAVVAFIKSSEDVQLVKFVKDFQSKARSISTDFGSTDYMTIDVPEKFSRVCIIDINLDTPDGSAPNAATGCSALTFGGLTNEICDEWKELNDDIAASLNQVKKKNVYFIDNSNKIGYKDYIPDIKIDITRDGFICTKDGKIKMEGLAQQAELSLA